MGDFFTVKQNASRRAPPTRFSWKCTETPLTDIKERADLCLVCVLPRGASPEEQFEIADPPLELRTNRPVRFQAYYSNHPGTSQVGEVVKGSERNFHALPPLETIIKLADQPATETMRTLPVRLKAKMNELGLLQVACVSADPSIRQSWPLEFNLRPHEQDSQGAPGSETNSEFSVPAGPNAAADALEAARKRIAVPVYRTRQPS